MIQLKDSIEMRRSYYAISGTSPVSDKEIEAIVRHALLHVPSAFNSQTTRIVLLLGEEHQKLWNIVKETLRAIVPAANFGKTETRIASFAAGHGTVLFFEDTQKVHLLQEQFALYADNFPIWSQQTSAMHQYAVWMMLEDAGLGASLQHYNPLIDDEVRRTWALPADWQLVAQMPFGQPVAKPDAKVFEPVEARMKVYSGYSSNA